MLLVSYSIRFYVLLFRFLEFCLVVLGDLLQIIELTNQVFVIYLFLPGIRLPYLSFRRLRPEAQFRLSRRFHMEVLKEDLVKIWDILAAFGVRTMFKTVLR